MNRAAMTNPDMNDPSQTLSDDYRKQLTEKHASDDSWGNTSIRHYPLILQMMDHFKIKSVLDYGCGKGMLGKKFREEQQNPDFRFKDVPFYEYDPGIPEKMHDRSKAELLINTDVLEHIEPEFLQKVLADMGDRTLRVAFLVISCVPAIHRLPDGRNAHLIIEHPNWWIEQLNQYFKVAKAEYVGGELYVVALSKHAEKTESDPSNEVSEVKKKLTETDKTIKKARTLIENRKFTQARNLLTGIADTAGYPESQELLGRIFYETGDYTKSATYFLEYANKTKNPDGFKMAGICLAKTERHANALKCLEHPACNPACMGDPQYREALMQSWNRTFVPEKTVALFESFNDNAPEHFIAVAEAHLLLQNLDKALDVTKKGIETYPESALLYAMLEKSYNALKRFEDALAASRKSIELMPDNAALYSNQGLSLINVRRFDEALQSFSKAIELDHLMTAAYLNRSSLYRHMGDFEKAQSHVEACLEIEPVAADIHYGYGANLLRMEQYEEAFAELEWYWHKAAMTSARMPDEYRRWYGEDITGKSLLFTIDQGIGDTIMMMRYIDLIYKKHNPRRIVINANRKLHNLFRYNYAEHIAADRMVINASDAPMKTSDVNLMIAASTAPHVLKTSIDTIPTPEGYIRKADGFDYKTGTDKEFVIGISWHTKSLDAGYIRSLKLMDFAFLAEHKNIRVIDLQYGDTSAERADAAAKGFDILHDDRVDSWNDMQPFMAQLCACDLVISIDNTTVHAAGAMGIPCWVLLPQEAYWRWPIRGEATPWYNSLRLFRQKSGETLQDLLGQVKTSLRAWLDGDASQLQPPPFKRLFPARPKPEKQALLVNDTSACYTWSHFANCEGLKTALGDKGYAVKSYSTLALDWLSPQNPSLQDFDDPKFLAACRYRDTSLFFHIENADQIIINGEGMLNSLGDSALRLLYLAYISKVFFKKQTSIINHSCYPQGSPKLDDPQKLAFYHKVYSGLDHCVVRDGISNDLLKSIGVSSRLGTDASLLWLEKHLGNAPAPTASKNVILTASPGYQSQSASAYAKACKSLKKQGFNPVLLMGAKWHQSREDQLLADDLAELAPDSHEVFRATTIKDYADTLLSASLVISGFYETCTMAHALNIPVIPCLAGSFAVTMHGLARTSDMPAPLDNQSEVFEKQLDESIRKWIKSGHKTEIRKRANYMEWLGKAQANLSWL